ncbi:glycoside hydrolase family 2 TIM barrel-domain containing protein [Lentisphaerota bacterium WC36G]|nr:DUF4982 domain-containing protein [Lentisphaerae bacterium WC36]
MRKRSTNFFRSLLLICGMVSSANSLMALEKQNVKSSRLNENWQFHKGEIGSPWEAWRKSFKLNWQKVTLPHCYNAEDAIDPDVKYYQGPAWYKNSVTIDNPYKNGRTLLHFEGSGQRTGVYIYMTKAGYHEGGYDEFTVDITDYIKKYRQEKKNNSNSKVPLLIRCDNTRDTEFAPSDISDFFIYGGIYRYLNLKYVPQVSLKTVHIKSQTTKDLAKVNILVDLYNPDKIAENAKLTIKIFDPNNKLISTQTVSKKLWEEMQQIVSLEIAKPILWDVDQPNLYRCSVTLETLGYTTTKSSNFGLRFFEFLKGGPFKLNERRLLIRGTSRHEDHAGVGAAMTEEMIKKEMTMMKEMGVNFIRLGHYQQSKIVLNMCDKLGILVWEEVPWCRGGLGGTQYQNRVINSLKNLISQHYNHPSIVVWGLGNENDWPGDFPTYSKQAIINFMEKLNSLAHKLDNSRVTGIRRCHFCANIVDVYSPSIWAGWYRGKFTEYKKATLEHIKKYPNFVHMEWGGSSHATRHSESPDEGLAKIKTGQGTDERGNDFLLSGGQARASKDSNWSETYICNLFDWHLKEQETMPTLTGATAWIFKDFGTPVRPENPVPYMNQKGVIERDFTKKEGYYVFASYWSKKPVIRIYGHTWKTRYGKKSEKKLIKVYSNLSEVELFVNGISQGIKKRNSQDFPAAGLRWSVIFNEGKNTLKAVGKRDGKVYTDQFTTQYQTAKWGKVSKLQVAEITRKNDIATIEVMAYDKNNIKCLTAKNVIRFELAGDGKLIDNLGTVRASRKVQLANGRATIQIKLNNGVSSLAVKSKNLPTKIINLK